MNNSTTEPLKTFLDYYNENIWYEYMCRYILSTLGIFGNTVLIIAVKNMRINRRPSHLLMASLGGVDIIFNCLIFIQHINNTVSMSYKERLIACYVEAFLRYLSMFGNALHFVLLAVDRYLCIAHPHR